MRRVVRRDAFRARTSARRCARSAAKASAMSAATPRSQRQQPRRGEVGAQVGQQQAHGAQDAGIARHQDAADLQLPAPAARHAAARRRRTPPACSRADRGRAAREITRIARAMLAVTTEMMPCAVCHRAEAEPARPAARSPAAPGRCRIAMRPPSRCVGFSVCSTTLASVTVGSALPRAVADRARDRRRRCAARPSAARRCRCRRSSRRRRRRCGCRASAP